MNFRLQGDLRGGEDGADWDLSNPRAKGQLGCPFSGYPDLQHVPGERQDHLNQKR